MYCYKAKVLRVFDGCRLALLVDLGFNVHARVDVVLAGISTYNKTNYQDIQTKIGMFVSDWLSGHGKIYVETIKQSVCDEEGFLAKVYSDSSKQACLNVDLLESGLFDFDETHDERSA